ncbi:MAG: hypothetical protein M3O50_11480 [Myxococcota bacterium]|nr:hypothetical protein [Myxococcota bacterium]
MTKRCVASSAVAIALLAPGAASAQTQYTSQPDSPQWLSDRRYNEGIGIRTGDLELHPGIAGEAGYDSNWFLRSTRQGVANGPPLAPVVPALEFRISPSLYLSTLGPRRREGDVVAAPPSATFRAGINGTYREFVGLTSDAKQPQNDVSGQRNISMTADARVDILPERPWGAGVFGNYARVIQPNSATADPNLAYTRDDVGVGGELVAQPGGGTLDWHFGYQFREALFEQSAGAPFDNMTHEAFTRGRWKFRPRTALVYDATLRFTSYLAQDRAAQQGLVNSTPVRMRIGLNGLVGERFAALAMIGWGASFDDTVLPTQPQYDSLIAQAELKWFLAANPGGSGVGDLGLALSSIALGYTRDFQNSYLGNFYGLDRGYLRFNYFFAGRALVTLEGGVGAVQFPDIYWLTPGAPRLRHAKFTDVRADATLFSEYRLADSFGVNATLRYTANISNTHDIPGSDGPNAGVFDMAWNRFEAFLGVRWFM